jgi:hypothetical protein
MSFNANSSLYLKVSSVPISAPHMPISDSKPEHVWPLHNNDSVLDTIDQLLPPYQDCLLSMPAADQYRLW